MRLSRAGLPFFLTRATPQREGKGRQALLRDLVAALRTLSVRAAGKPGQCVLDVNERFGLHFEQRDVDVLLQIDVRRLGGIRYSEQFSSAILADVTELRIEIGLKFAASSFEHLLQLCVAYLAHVLSSVVCAESPLLLASPHGLVNYRPLMGGHHLRLGA
jgi:hypothetical protein